MHGRVGGDRVLARLSGHENRLAREDAVSRRTDKVDASVVTVRALETRGRSGGSLPWSLLLASQPGSIRHLVTYPAAAHGVEPTEPVIASREGEPSASLHEPAQATSSSGTSVGGH